MRVSNTYIIQKEISEDFKYSDRIYIPEECAETGENGKCTRICQCRQCTVPSLRTISSAIRKLVTPMYCIRDLTGGRYPLPDVVTSV